MLTGDTAPSPPVVQAAHGADLLVHEASFLAEEAERARETMHSTAAQAAEVARLAQVRLLALTHVSPRYFGPELADEAREVFPDTVVPRDFDLIEVPFPERGAPRLVRTAPGRRGPRRTDRSAYDGRRNERDGSGGGGGRRRRGGGDAGDPPQRRHRVVDRAGARRRRGAASSSPRRISRPPRTRSRRSPSPTT